PDYGKRKPHAYGGALDFSHWAAYPGVSEEMAVDPLETYQGLQPYRDMAKLDEKKPGRFGIPFQSPYFLVGLTWPLSDITGGGPRFTGHLDLAEYDGDDTVDHLGVIAKSQLYYSRPTNLKYFLRKDKKKEKPNVFGPFWQARLVDTTDAERFLALAIQQKTWWLTKEEKSLVGGSVLDTVLRAVDEVLEVVSNVLDRIIRLFL
ncbi:MAG TPA: hypothetical protein VJ969_08815, partial [Desulfopila sp.]|nr:hypothetical protein [Desulfopila sp.]